MPSLLAAVRGVILDRLACSRRGGLNRLRGRGGRGKLSERLEAKVMLSAVVANDDSFGVLHTFSLEGVDVVGNDLDNSPFMEGLTVSLVSDVSQGTLTLDPGGTFEYIPSGTYVGVDSFVYEASNSYGSDQATVTIDVGNIPPVADDLTFDIPHSTTLSDAWVSATNDDGDTLTFSLDGGVSAGSLVFHASGSFQYTPPVGFVTTPGNPVTFDYIVDDGFDTDTGTVSINVYNVAPTAEGDGPYSTLETFTLTVDAAEGLLVNDSDFDGNSLDLIVSYYTQPENGTVSVASDGSFEYTPDADFVGSDYFEYRVQDPQGAESELALVQLTSGTFKIEVFTNPFADEPWIDPAMSDDRIVGQKVQLRVIIEGVEPAGLTYTWQVGAIAVKGYTTSSALGTGEVQPLEASDLDQASIAVHWVDGGAKNITATVADQNGNQTSKSASIEVLRPDVSFSGVTHHATITPDGTQVRLGDLGHIDASGAPDPIPGIQFHVGDLGQFSGSLRLTQLNDTWTIRQRTGLAYTEFLEGTGVDVDAEYPADHDIPGLGWGSTWEWFRREDRFITYLMYKPDGADSIWVPLKKLNWWWGVRVEEQTGEWVIVMQEGTLDTSTEGVDTSEFPEWSTTVQAAILDENLNLNWQPTGP